MAFRINDLIISIVEGGDSDSDDAARCPKRSCLFCSGTPEMGQPECAEIFFTTECRITKLPPEICRALLLPSEYLLAADAPTSMQDLLARLKAQLKEAIAKIENEEAIVIERLAPKTIGEIEKLEGRLSKALVTIRDRKERLSRRSQPKKAPQKHKTSRKRK
jgi:hypothetical protein